MVATVPIKLLNSRFPINEFRYASRTGSTLMMTKKGWSDIEGLTLAFDENESGNFLVTLNIQGAIGSIDADLHFGVVLRDQSGEHSLADVACPQVPGLGAFSLACLAPIALGGSTIVAQWQPVKGGEVMLNGELCSLSAVGSLALKKEAFTDTNHFEYPELFSRGLRLTNYSEVLFLTGYSATAAIRPLEFKGIENLVLDAEGQMQWIVDHLDKFFETIPYADGSGVYSKHDIVYFDLVIDKTVGDKAQTDVLKVLEKWFGPQKSGDPNVPDKLEVIPRPSTGILKKVEALAFPSTKVEIEFILAH